MSFQILSLSGGGFLGLYSVTVLAELEAEAKVPLGRCFDLIAGTSVGGIIALAVAAEVPMAAVKGAFERDGTKIFSERGAPQSWLTAIIDLLRAAFRPKYSNAGLRSVLVDILGEDTRLADLKHPLMIPAVNLTKGAPQVFKTPHHETYKRDLHQKAIDVALATSAAPTYFPPAEDGDELFADGGLYANAPDQIAPHEAEHFLKIPVADVRMLSIGTTTARFSFSHRRATRLGILGWAMNQRLVHTMIASQQINTQYILAHRLGDRYVRMDHDQSREQERDLGLDIANDSAQRTIRALGQATVRRFIGNATVAEMLTHRAPSPTWLVSTAQKKGT